MDQYQAPITDLIAIFQARASALDAASAFPHDNIADLRTIGALTAPLPRHLGGNGAGTEPEGAPAILHLLRTIGQGHLPTGRLFEGHVNAIKLVATYGSPAQLADMADTIAAGHLLGLWVTDGPEPARLEGHTLAGGKLFCSGAGHIAHALITAQPPSGDPVMALIHIDPARATPSAIRLQGMRSATTGQVDLTFLPATTIGQPGDYLRPPIFSSGAWRTSAVTLGGIDALVAILVGELHSRGRASNPHQQTRLGQAFIAQETASLFLAKAARIAEANSTDPGTTAAYVNLARLAVERAALDAIELTQRSLGLSALVQGHPAERLMRDLATYLRQPAPDETLTEAAAWFTDHGLPA